LRPDVDNPVNASLDVALTADAADIEQVKVVPAAPGGKLAQVEGV
jgi:hypothetical protein